MKRPTAADVAAVAVSLAVGIALAAAPRQPGSQGDRAVIRVIGERPIVMGLDRDTTFTIRGALGETIVRVGGGQLQFISSACPQKICVERGPISMRGDYVVCVPNGVYAKIVGKSEYDAVVP